MKNSKKLCNECRADIGDLVDHLLNLIDCQLLDDVDHWGKLGSMSHVRKLLAETVSFYGGLAPKDILMMIKERRAGP